MFLTNAMAVSVHGVSMQVMPPMAVVRIRDYRLA